MEELRIFENPEFGQIRATVSNNGEPLFVAADVCRALEHSNVTMALDRLDDDEKTKLNLGLSGGATNCVTEAGLYSLVLGSRKKEARQFKRWVTHEVIPSIRKHGAYMTPETVDHMIASPEFGIKLLTALKEEQDRRKSLEAKAQENAPKVLFADAVSAAHTSILVGELAKLLKQNGVEMGQNRLFRWLRSNGYLIQRQGQDFNMPTQKSMELGLFEIKETAITHADGHTTVTKTPKVTGKGQQYFVRKFLEGRA